MIIVIIGVGGRGSGETVFLWMGGGRGAGASLAQKELPVTQRHVQPHTVQLECGPDRDRVQDQAGTHLCGLADVPVHSAIHVGNRDLGAVLEVLPQLAPDRGQALAVAWHPREQDKELSAGDRVGMGIDGVLPDQGAIFKSY